MDEGSAMVARSDEQHFGTHDKSVNFIDHSVLNHVLRGILAFREPITNRDVNLNCLTAKRLKEHFNIHMMDKAPNPPKPIKSKTLTERASDLVSSSFKGLQSIIGGNILHAHKKIADKPNKTLHHKK